MKDIIKFDDKVIDNIINAAWGLLGCAIIITLGLLTTHFLVRIFKKSLDKTKIDPSLVLFFSKCLRIVCYVIITISALSEIGISTTGIIAGFSAAAAAFALALKDNLSDIAGGVVILFSRPFVTGDFVEFDNYKGYVEKIDLMHTYITTYDNTSVVIPNSKVTSNKINNYTSNPVVRVQVFVPIGYNDDLDKAKEIILGTMKRADKLVLENHEPVVRLERFLDSSLEVIARCWTNFENYWEVYYFLTENIKKDLEKNGIYIPFNQLDVHLDNNSIVE